MNEILKDTIEWIPFNIEQPPIHTYIWLCNIDNKETSHSYVYGIYLTTKKFEKYWTHWALAKIPV